MELDDGSEQPFLEPDPPPWAARGLAWLLILAFLAALAGSVLIRVPEVVSSPFTLVPVRGGDPVRAPRRGIVAEVRVAEGEAIRGGQTLFVVGSREAGDRSAELRSLEAQIEGAAEALDNARAKRASERQAEREDARALRRRVGELGKLIDVKRQQIALRAEVIERRRSLHEQGLTSWEDVVTHELEARQLELELGQLEADRQSARADLARLRPQARMREMEFRELERRLNEEIATSGIRAAALREELLHSDGAAVSVPAACAGTVLRLVARAPGAVVQEGELLAEVACAREALQAELAVPQSGVGRIEVGQPVKLLYDAFPYQRYGVRTGTVDWIGPAAVDLGGSQAFLVRVEAADRTVAVDGESRPLLPGMGGRADIVVGRRSLLSYALGPLRQLRESMSVPAAPSAAQPAGSAR